MKNKITAVLIEREEDYILLFSKSPTKKQLNKEIHILDFSFWDDSESEGGFKERV